MGKSSEGPTTAGTVSSSKTQNKQKLQTKNLSVKPGPDRGGVILQSSGEAYMVVRTNITRAGQGTVQLKRVTGLAPPVFVYPCLFFSFPFSFLPRYLLFLFCEERNKILSHTGGRVGTLTTSALSSTPTPGTCFHQLHCLNLPSFQ